MSYCIQCGSLQGEAFCVDGNAYNLDLSKRRTAAVKQALVTEYSIAPQRLTTDGYGASRPIDTNDTSKAARAIGA